MKLNASFCYFQLLCNGCSLRAASSSTPELLTTMAGALMTMPMLVINMGAEMVYVLDQRLKAQNIPREKSAKGEKRAFRCCGRR